LEKRGASPASLIAESYEPSTELFGLKKRNSKGTEAPVVPLLLS
jgi:hypothetical protein